MKSKTQIKTANHSRMREMMTTKRKEKKSKKMKMIKALSRSTWRMMMKWSRARLNLRSKVREALIRPTLARRIRSLCSRARELGTMSSESLPRTCIASSRMINFQLSRTKMAKMRTRTTRSRAKKRCKRKRARTRLMARRRKKQRPSSRSPLRRSPRKRTCPGSIKWPYKKRSR